MRIRADGRRAASGVTAVLTGQAVLITGAARGLGVELARRFAREGADLALSTRPESREALDALAESLRHDGIRAVVVTADLVDPAQRVRLIDDCRAELGRIDILVNNAGIEIPGPFATHPPECIHELIETNLMAPMQLARQVLPEMLARGSGRIVSVAALAGRLPMPFHATYGAAAAGLLAWSASLREELRGTGVRVSAICPGFVIDTGMHARMALRMPRGFGAIPAERVCDAMLDAIARDRGEVLLGPRSLRPWLALLAIAPGAAAALYRRSGLRDFLARRAAKALDRRG